MLGTMIGTLATLCVIISYFPQLIKAYKTKSLEDFSWLYLIIIFTGIVLWFVYGLIINDLVIIYANIVISLLAGSLLLMKYLYRKNK